MIGHWKWWILVAVNIFFLLTGQSVATLLGRLYYNDGGNSKWMATLVQSAAFPILLVPYFLFPSDRKLSSINASPPSVTKVVLSYILLGLLIAGDNMMYSYGLLYLPVSTYSLVCASQLAFNVLFSYLLNAQKITPYILNSVILLTFSTSLLATSGESSSSTGISVGKYAVGFTCTIGASATYSLLLSLMQLVFQRVLKKNTFSVVLEMQIYTSLVATVAVIVGLFASGEWRTLKGEMDNFTKGRLSYIMVLVWTAMGWQVCSVGVVGLIFVVSSLFSNVVSAMALPLVPILAVIFFHDKMGGEKIVALLLAVWGFVSYIYHHYLDDSESKVTTCHVDDCVDSGA